MNTKHIHKLLFIIAIFCVTPCTSQTKIPPKYAKQCEKLFKKAIKNGRNSEGVYELKVKSVTNSTAALFIPGLSLLGRAGNYNWEARKYMPEYLRPKGYSVITMGHSGGDMTFIETDKFDDYICRKLTSLPYDSFKNNGNYISQDWSLDSKFLWAYDERRKAPTTTHSIYWSGNVANGYIEGEGVGFIKDGYDYYVFNNGTFRHGFATTDVDVKRIKWKGEITENGQWKYIELDEKSTKIGQRSESEILSLLSNTNLKLKEAAIGYYKDYHASLSKEKRDKLDEKAFINIKNQIDLDFYVGAFPNGRHIQEAVEWKSANYEGFRVYQQETIKRSVELIQTYIKEKINGDSNLFEMKTTQPRTNDMSDIENENERLLKRSYDFAKDIQKNLADDNNAQDKAQSFFDYLSILNAFYAVKKSFNYTNYVEEDFWGNILSPNPKTTYTLTSKGREIKSLFENAGNIIDKRINDNHYGESDLLLKTYDYIYKYYSSFIKNVNGELTMKNKLHVHEKLSGSSFKEYRFDKGELIITLQNGDKYYFRTSEDGKWKYSSGKTRLVLPSLSGYNSIEDAIKRAEEMNRDFWNSGK